MAKTKESVKKEYIAKVKAGLLVATKEKEFYEGQETPIREAIEILEAVDGADDRLEQALSLLKDEAEEIGEEIDRLEGECKYLIMELDTFLAECAS